MHRRLVATLFLALGSTQLACSQAVDTEEQDPVGASFEPIVGGTPATDYPEAAYLNIDVPASGVGTYWACSASVIAPRVVLTAGHCVDGHSTWQVYVGAQYRVSTSAATYDWQENGAETVNPAHHDIGLVFLSSDVVLPSYPAIATAPLRDGVNVVNVGRIRSGTLTNSLYEATGPVVGGAAFGYPFDYESADIIQPGDSGGPDYLSGTHTIVAVNSGAGSGVEVLARVDLLASWIQSQIAAHSAGAVAASDAGASKDGAPDALPLAEGGAKDAGAKDGAPEAAPIADAGPLPDARAADDAGAKDGAPPAPPIADAGHDAVAEGGAKDAGPPTPSTAQEQEPNNTLALANVVAAPTLTGALGTTSDVDWFRVTAPVGATTFVLSAASDAVFSTGVASGTTCPFALGSVKSARVNVSGAPVSVCVYVSSPSHKVQSYTLSIAR